MKPIKRPVLTEEVYAPGETQPKLIAINKRFDSVRFRWNVNVDGSVGVNRFSFPGAKNTFEQIRTNIEYGRNPYTGVV